MVTKERIIPIMRLVQYVTLKAERMGNLLPLPVESFDFELRLGALFPSFFVAEKFSICGKHMS